VTVTERAINAGSAADAAWLAALTAIEAYDDHPSQYTTDVAPRMIGLYGYLLTAEADAWAAYTSSLTVPTGVRSPGGGGVPDGTAPPAVASGVASGPGGGPLTVSRAAPHLQPSDR